MSELEIAQHVPVFVGSTYEDMRPYRKAVREALHQLEAVVRGMEYFGSRPGTPLDECLASVRSCKLYIGVFGMRYGSTPDGYEKSFTHLEYEEAQQQGLPSLIYIFDDINERILVKDIEFGIGAEKLKHLKGHLRKTHLCGSYTSPADLASKIIHDVPAALAQAGANVNEFMHPVDSYEMISKFLQLPKIYNGRELVVDFMVDGFRPVSADECEALNLSAGATLSDYVRLSNDQAVWIYATNEAAPKIVDAAAGSTVKATCSTVFGIGKEVITDSDDKTIVRDVEHKGLLITRLHD